MFTQTTRTRWKEVKLLGQRLDKLNEDLDGGPSTRLIIDAWSVAIPAMIAILALGFVFFLALTGKVHAEDFDPTMYCNAIGKAECGPSMTKCQYYYGIRSVHYADFLEARHICHNTVRHSHQKWLASTRQTDFLTFLGSTYCPVKGKGLTPQERRLNANWVKNVRYWLRKDSHEQF